MRDYDDIYQTLSNMGKNRQNRNNKGLESEGQRLKHTIHDSNNSVLMKRKH